MLPIVEELLRTIIPGILLGLLVGWVLRNRPEYSEYLDPRNWSLEIKISKKRALLLGIFLFSMISISMFADTLTISGIEKAGGDVMKEKNVFTNWANFSYVWFFFAITAYPILEEWIFRGILLEEVKRRTNSVWIALALTSLLFGVVHLTNPGTLPLAIIPYTISGLIYGIAYVTSGFPGAIITHIGSNLFPFIVGWVLMLI